MAKGVSLNLFSAEMKWPAYHLPLKILQEPQPDSLRSLSLAMPGIAKLDKYRVGLWELVSQ